MSTIQNNNADLQAILDTVQALPDKVAAPEYETYNVNFYVDKGMNYNIHYMTVIDGKPQPAILDSMTTVNYCLNNVLNNTLLYFENDAAGDYPDTGISSIDGSAGAQVIYTKLVYGESKALFLITADTVPPDITVT